MYQDQPKKSNSGTRGEGDLTSLYNSQNRTQRTILDYALNNDFTHLTTFTIDPKGFDSTNIDLILNKIWDSVSRNLNLIGVKYLAVPELHKDKRKYHLHVLIIANSGFEQLFNKWGMLYNRKRKKWEYVGSEFKLWKWGFSNVKRIEKDPTDLVRLGNYLKGYVTKELIVAFNRKRFWASRGLKRGNVIRLGTYSPYHRLIDLKSTKWDYKGKKGYFIVSYAKKEGESFIDTLKRIKGDHEAQLILGAQNRPESPNIKKGQLSL